MPGFPIPTLKWQPSLYTGVLAFVLLACIAFIGIDVANMINTRSMVLNQAQISSLNLASSLAVHADDTFQRASAILTGFKERVETSGLGPAALERLRRVSLLHLNSQPALHDLLVVAENGDGIIGTYLPTDHRINYADRDYFQYHKTHPDKGPVVSGPLRSKIDGTWILVVSRRFDKSNGDFGGLVLATISLSTFDSFYKTFEIGQHGIISLSNVDGTVVTRRPLEKGLIGKRLAIPARFQELLKNVPAFSFDYISTVDGIDRIGSVARLEHYPFLVAVGESKEVALSNWKDGAYIRLSVTILAALLIAGLGIWLARQVRDRQRAERLFRLLADHSSDAIVRTDVATGRYLFLSPAFYSMTGYEAGALEDLPWHSHVHPDDLAALHQELLSLGTDNDELTLTYRRKRFDGSYMWCEARIKVIRGSDFRPIEYIANIRDISIRKAVEEKLATAREELITLSVTDSLTGIANRRKFDDALNLEWRRAIRDRTPLTLMLIDIDHFKKYNDRYGHQKGDECLTRVAQALAASVGRSTDLVARYGGEEFAVILPDTGAPSGELMAEKIRAAVEALKLPHLSSPQSLVTISLGFSTAIPATDDLSSRLINEADIALYQAKNNGRNRVKNFAEMQTERPEVTWLVGARRDSNVASARW